MQVKKPDYLQELGSVDICQLKSVVANISSNVWQQQDDIKENKFFCFHHTQHIIFRFIPRTHDPKDAYSQPIWLAWQGIILPILQGIAKKYPYEKVDFPKVMLAKLEPGHIINRHTDNQKSNLVTHKIHVPLYTNPDAYFLIKDKSFHLQEGHAYEVNNIVPHGVENKGKEPRIHLIFEIFNTSL